MAKRTFLLGMAVALSFGLSACISIGEGETRNFAKDFTVTGPVTLDLQNGSGDITITAGGDGRVKVRGEVRMQEFLFEVGSRRRIEDVVAKPPITQTGDVLRFVRPQSDGPRSIRIHYTIEAPAKTEIRVRNSSGDVSITGVAGPLSINTSSGDIVVANIQERVDVSAGSGDITARQIRGALIATARSGDLELDDISGEIRAQTGSGDIRIDNARGKVSAEASSGEITIDGVPADLRVQTGSGDVRIVGDPAANALWEIETRSGRAELDVSNRASFQLAARSRSDIDSDIEMTIEERSRRSLRGRVGKGDARVRIDTGSGHIRVH